MQILLEKLGKTSWIKCLDALYYSVEFSVYINVYSIVGLLTLLLVQLDERRAVRCDSHDMTRRKSIQANFSIKWKSLIKKCVSMSMIILTCFKPSTTPKKIAFRSNSVMNHTCKKVNRTMVTSSFNFAWTLVWFKWHLLCMRMPERLQYHPHDCVDVILYFTWPQIDTTTSKTNDTQNLIVLIWS